MKLARSIAAHSILAVGGLVLAYLVWTDDSPEVSADEVTITPCDADDVTRVALTTEDKDVTLELRGEGAERVAWLTVVRRPAEGEPTTERFVGSDAVAEWLATAAPLRARRSLGELSAEQLEGVGLDEPEGTLAFQCGGASASFRIGGRAYGNGDRYLRAERGGPVYLVASDKLAPLESAEFRLMERQLHTFEWREVVALRLRAFDQERELLQHNRLDEQRAEWVDARTPDRRDETLGNWLSRFPRLRVQSYLEPEAQPGADLSDLEESVAPERVMRVEYRGARGELGFLELSRVTGASELSYYARSETTRSWVRVPSSLAQQIEDDLRSMLGVAPLERPASAAPAPSPAASGDAGASAPDGGTSAAVPAPAPEPAPAPAP